MNLRCVAVLLAMIAGLVGCGPKPAPPTGEPSGSSPTAVSLDGTWVATKVDVPEGLPAPPQEELDRMVAMVNGKLVTARRKDDSQVMYFVIEVDTAKSPNVVTIHEADAKGDTGPKKSPATMLGGGVKEMSIDRWKVRGLLTVDGDAAKLAISSEPEVVPTEIAPKASTAPPPAPITRRSGDTQPLPPRPLPADRATVVVVHLKRVKETPEWATKPPPPAPPTQSTAPRTAKSTGK